MGSDDIAAARERLAQPFPAERSLTVRLLPDHPYPGVTPSEVWTAELGGARTGAELPIDVLAELSVALERVDGYELSGTRKYVEWGASGGDVEVLLQIAEWVLQGAVGGLAYDGLRRTVRRMADRHAAHLAKHGTPREPLTADEAASWGQWRVSSAYGIPPDEMDTLVVVGEDCRADGSWVIRYEFGDRRYEAEMVEADGLVWITRVGWKQRETDDDD